MSLIQPKIGPATPLVASLQFVPRPLRLHQLKSERQDTSARYRRQLDGYLLETSISPARINDINAGQVASCNHLNEADAPDACQNCVESFLRENYEFVLSMNKKGRILCMTNQEYNLKIWTFRIMARALVRSEKSLGTYQPTQDNNSSIWSYRIERSERRRGRSRSPDLDFFSGRTNRRNATNRGNDMRKYRERSPLKVDISKSDREIDDLCDWLLDVKVGLDKDDKAMQRLVAGVQNMTPSMQGDVNPEVLLNFG